MIVISLAWDCVRCEKRLSIHRSGYSTVGHTQEVMAWLVTCWQDLVKTSFVELLSYEIQVYS
eukprot:3386286-Amphidinium_carterae.1